MKKALITLIHKKQERTLWKNYRPISLLNISYKIYSKALANRLKNVLDQVIDEDQIGCVPKRFIGENIMLFLEAYEHMTATGGTGAFLFLDFEKAFDRVERTFIWSSMENMNFGPKFISFCKTLYSGSFSNVLVNGHPSKRVEVHTGVRQGCPIAALLYLIACEPMANMIRSDSLFQGLTMPKIRNTKAATRLCISQYCDDTLLFCANINDVRRAQGILALYELGTGQKFNYSKSPALYVGLPPPQMLLSQFWKMTTLSEYLASTSEFISTTSMSGTRKKMRYTPSLPTTQS